MKKRIGYGTFGINDVNTLKQCIKQAVICGYDFIDTAYIYRNELAIGNAITLLKNEGFNKMIKIQTKIWPDFYDNVKKAVLSAIKKLQVNKLDMCLLHRRHFDLNKDISAFEQLIECQKNGLVSEIGVSNYDRDELEIIYQKTHVRPFSNQIELSINNFRLDRVVYNQSKQIEVQAWSPLGDIEKNQKNAVLITLSKKYNIDVAGIAIAYLSSQNLSVVVKSKNPQRIITNRKAFNVILDPRDIAIIKQLNTFDIKYSQSYVYDLE